jgi:hypothetical protein
VTNRPSLGSALTPEPNRFRVAGFPLRIKHCVQLRSLSFCLYGGSSLEGPDQYFATVSAHSERSSVWTEGDALDTIIPAAARRDRFVRQDLSPELQKKLGAALRENKYEIKPLLETIFLSRDFYCAPVAVERSLLNAERSSVFRERSRL